MRLRRVLPIANALACVLFVVLREPAPAAYLAEVDEARRNGGMFFNSAITGTLACRNLYPWSEWHGGEALGVKILEIANLPALILTAIAHLLGEVLGIARLMLACQWSWILAVGFVLVASAQWWLVGTAVDRLKARFGRSTP
jgi:hypothetical protein